MHFKTVKMCIVALISVKEKKSLSEKHEMNMHFFSCRINVFESVGRSACSCLRKRRLRFRKRGS